MLRAADATGHSVLADVEMPRTAQLTRGAEVTTLAEFAATHGLALTRFAFVLCGDRGVAEDLVQDTYLALYRRYGDVLALDAPVAYARRAIVNAYVSRGRRRSAHELASSELPDQPVEMATRDEQDAMWQALAGLPDRQRAVLVLRYYVDLADREIARVIGASEGTVRSLAARAFAALRDDPSLRTKSAEDQR
jgi:RNA polymerase sigma-70 factor (sigma-E family)